MNDYKGELAYQNGSYGLLRTASRNGRVLYRPFNGFRIEKEGYIDNITPQQADSLNLTPKQLEELVNTAEQLEDDAANTHAISPSVTYNNDGVAVSKDIPADYANLFTAFKRMLLPDAKVYFTTLEDAQANKETFTGPHRILGTDSSHTSGRTLGSLRQIGPNEYAITLRQPKRPADSAFTVELVAHEIGHAHQREFFEQAPKWMKDALVAAHAAWVNTTKGKSAHEVISGLRSYKGGISSKKLSGPFSSLPKKDQDYILSFSEWYADQVARWAVSNAKPVSAVEQFFSRLGKSLRKFYDKLKNAGFLPNETFVQYLEQTTKDLDLTPAFEARSGEPTYASVRERLDKALNDKTINKGLHGTVSDLVTKKARPPAVLDAALTDLIAKQLEKGAQDAGVSEMREAPKPRPKKVPRVSAQVRKAMASQNATRINKGVGQMFVETRSADDAIKLLKRVGSRLNINATKKLLGALTTDDITRWIGDKIKNIPTINKLVEDLNIRRAEFINELAEKVPAWAAFNAKFVEAGEKLADIMHDATLKHFDPAAHANLQQALKNDVVLNGLRTKGASKSALTARENVVKDFMHRWVELGKVDNGEAHRIYVMARDSYAKTFDTHMKLLTDRITASDMSSANKKRTLDYITRQFQEAKQLGVYFPLMRYGKFWFREGVGKNSEFYMFESGTARDKAIEDRIAEKIAKGDTRSVETILSEDFDERGDNVSDIRKLLSGKGEGTSTMLKDIFNMLDSGSASDVETIKEQVYQMFLATLPEKDMRTRFARRKGVTGYSADALRNFVASQTIAGTQLSRLEYAPKIRMALGQAYAEMKGNTDKLKLIPFIDEIAKRALTEVSPTSDYSFWDKAASLGSKFTFMWALTAPKSALVNLTSLPIVGFPVLSARYGMPRTLAMSARYLNIFDKLLPKEKDANGTITTKWGAPSVAKSAYVTGHKDPVVRKALIAAYKAAEIRGLFMDTNISDMSDRGRVSSADYNSPISKTARGAYRFMTGAFHYLESVNRQIMYMSSFELEFNKLRGEGVSADQATERATRTALKLTNEAQFNYSQYNKPRYFKAPLGKLSFQFMTYPMQMTSFLVRNFHNSIKGKTPEERREAAVKFYGTMGMTALFSGVTGLGVGPLSYSTIMGLLDGLRDALRGDDDDDEDEEGNPLGKRSMSLWFTEWYLPHYFGPESGLAAQLGLSEEQANLLVRSIKKGPISALTDLNVGTSTSLDEMFFRSDTPAKSNREAALMFLGAHALGPFGSTLTQFAAAMDDFNNGRPERAYEKLAPALFRGPLVASRLMREGSDTPQGAEIKSAEWYTTGKLLGQSLGFGSTEVSDIQKTNFTAKRMTEQIKTERNSLLLKFRQAVRKYEENPSDANSAKIDAVEDAIDKYNNKNYMLPITGETKSSSLSGEAKSLSGAIDGLIVEDKFAPYVSDILGRARTDEDE